MKISHFYISVAVSALCLALSVTAVLLGNSNQSKQVELQKQQAQMQAQQDQINNGTAAQQVGTNILRDMAQVSIEDKAMKDVLAKHGYTVSPGTPAPSENQPATPAK